ncbi:MAG: DUF2865 domain-containing protein [Hyphomicrobiaceae bacterium]
MRTPSPRKSHAPSKGKDGLYRTICVRACDGYFFPISYGVTRSGFGQDEAACNRSCPGGHLYYGSIHNEYPDDLVNLSGEPYLSLRNANLFRKVYVESCKCKPRPWEQEAIDRHRRYAIEAQLRKEMSAGKTQPEKTRLPRRSEASSAR